MYLPTVNARVRAARRLLAAALACATPATAQVVWTNNAPAVAPAARKYTTMVWDSARQVVLLFGGQAHLELYFDDLWEWDGTVWRERAATVRPRAREDHMMAFDRARGRAVVFGGHDVDVVFLSDTWEWDGSAWTRANPTRVPAARAYGAMAYDDRRQRIVMFGGLNAARLELAETWEWDGTNWTLAAPAHSPPRRSHNAMAYDPISQRILLYGGTGPMGWYEDLWAWDGVDWQQLQPPKLPPSVMDHRMAYDRARSRLVAWGGRFVPGSRLLEHDGTRWIQRDVPGAPQERWAHALAYDEVHGTIVLFGGFDEYQERVLGDTWTMKPTYPAAFTTWGPSCPGALGHPRVLASETGLPWLGDPVAIRVGPVRDGSPAVLLLGSSDRTWNGVLLPLDLSGVGMAGCHLLVSVDVTLSMTTSQSVASAALQVPPVRDMLGLRLHGQALVRDASANPLGLVASNAVTATIGSK
jgi:hypothetical protein